MHLWLIPLPPLLSFLLIGLLAWWLLTRGATIEARVLTPLILPSPMEVLQAFPRLHFEQGLVRSAMTSFLRVTEGFLLAATSTLANQLPVSGGMVTKAYYLKRMYGLSYTKYLSSMLAIFFCTIAVYGLLGLAILTGWLAGRGAAGPAEKGQHEAVQAVQEHHDPHHRAVLVGHRPQAHKAGGEHRPRGHDAGREHQDRDPDDPVEQERPVPSM